MITRIKGELVEKNSEYCIIMTGGIGYQVYIPESNYNLLPDLGQEALLHTFLAVREDAMTLYGFTSTEQLTVFKMITNISGIGPKIALASVSTIPPTQFYLSVLNDQVNDLTKIPGIGKKSAQRMILELKEKVKDLYSTDLSSNTSLESTDLWSGEYITKTEEVAQLDELKEALNSLGYTGKEIDKIVNELRREINQEKTMEELLRLALQKLNSS